MEDFRKLTDFMSKDEKEKIDEMLQDLQPKLNVKEHIEMCKDAGAQAMDLVKKNFFFPVKMSSSYFWANDKIIECRCKIMSLKFNDMTHMMLQLNDHIMSLNLDREKVLGAWREKNEEVENLKERSKFFNHLGFFYLQIFTPLKADKNKLLKELTNRKKGVYECCICLEETSDERKLAALVPCGHTVCEDCSPKMPGRLCPTCRRNCTHCIVVHGIYE